ncbi:elongation factor P 5-aminopentanone reductase [Bacillus alveayuensis]|uniref:elongation factor P 5-aminopentanone reductase n=1 Tax=Aeribacillus alveayuensis TaxID=279215 RepID=UPI0005CDB002|nr:SDR family oxidoreductase [Bacillus alveayuensis]
MKTVFLTGGSGGIGLAISEKFAQEGYSLYIHYRNHQKPIQELMRKYPKTKIVPIQADFSIESEIFQAAEQITEPLDVVIYASGTSHYGLIQDVTHKEFQSLLSIHLKAPFYLTQQIVPKMIERKKGSIIMVSSIWGLTGAACEVAYSMVKGGQISFVKALAKELAPTGIRVNAIAPGAIYTKMNDHLSQEEKEMIMEEIPFGRFGMPEEVANAAYFLASEQSSYITGHVLSVNGGWYC